jgi:hypothetical protein
MTYSTIVLPNPSNRARKQRFKTTKRFYYIKSANFLESEPSCS